MAKTLALFLVTFVFLQGVSNAAEKNFNWSDNFFAGDCVSDTVSVLIKSDGTGELKSVSTTRRTWSGDKWWWRIEGLDAQKVRVWVIPFHEGPRMSQGRRFHNDFKFNFDKGLFQRTKFIRLYDRC